MDMEDMDPMAYGHEMDDMDGMGYGDESQGMVSYFFYDFEAWKSVTKFKFLPLDYSKKD